MNNTRNAHERLDALLSALEDAVLNGEGVLATDVKAMRAEIEDLIELHAGRSIQGNAAVTDVGGVKDKKSTAKELLGRLAGVGHRAVRSNVMPRVRMAFSSKSNPSEDGEHSKSRREGGSGKKGG